MNPQRIAVIDIGSNSIKLLVAGVAQPMDILYQSIRETRISVGIGTSFIPVLQKENMQKALGAVEELLAEAKRFKPDLVKIVATSAVRDAANGQDFHKLLTDKLGYELTILSGDEEAQLISAGIATDPAIRGCPNFALIDLGGGSMECMRWEGRKLARALSLKLGAVRIAERYQVNLHDPLSKDVAQSIRKNVSDTINESGFAFAPGEPLVGTGGAITVSRVIIAVRQGQPLHNSNPTITIDDLEALYEEVAAISYDERLNIPGLPPERADILPAALLIVLETARLAGARQILHSFRNLRFGIASQHLDCV